MAQAFPDDPYLSGFWAPFGAEIDAPDLVVEGELPDSLNGTFFRNGPDPAYAPKPGNKYHVFDGDGMIYALHLENGKASLKNRWVKTDKLKLEQEAGRRLFGVFGNPAFNDPTVNPMQYNTANTHIWPHAGKLYALMEGCPPIEIDPENLETVGSETYGGAVAGPFTAHPKNDYETGEMFAFGYAAKGPASTDIRYNVVDKDRNISKTEWLSQPYASMMHDFFLTENYVIFPCLPVTLDLMRAMQGGPMAAWDDTKFAAFGVRPRYGSGEDVKWIEVDPTFMFHCANAYEADGKLHVEVAGTKRAPLMPSADGSPPPVMDARQLLTRWTMGTDGETSDFKETVLGDLDMQFPRIDDRLTGRPYDYVYTNVASPGESGRTDGFDNYARYDIRDGSIDVYVPEEKTVFGEGVFVPRSPDAPGNDGHVLVFGWNKERNVSDFYVFSADDIGGGPVAKVNIPFRVPGGFHCSWMDAA
ncbi:MAG: carotenoid oxygenase family protein [Sphingomonadales bacterium]